MKFRRTVLLVLALLTFAPLVAAQESDGAGGADNENHDGAGGNKNGEGGPEDTTFADCMTDCRSGDHPNCTGICNLEAGKGCSFAVR